MNRQDAENAKREPGAYLDALAHEVIGAALEVHRLLGPDYLEKVYQKALEVELSLRGVPFVPQHQAALMYKGHDVGECFLDLLADNTLVVELKAVDNLAASTRPRSSHT